MTTGTSKAVTATVIACLASLGAALLPWLRTGQARRSAFTLARSADAIGFIDTPFRRALVISWYLLPMLTAAVWTAGAFRHPGLVAGLGALVGSMSVAAGSMVIAWTRPEPGSVAAVVAGGVTLGCAAWLARSATRPATGEGRAEGGPS
jgi:hypothetical protein